MNAGKHIRLLFAIIVAITVASYVFRGIMANPSLVVHELGGDGIKNYYTYIYHSLYGQGWWFNGMNYPYGEHIMFVDGQPALTITLGWLRNWWRFTPETLNVILNVLMFSAFILGILFIYRTLKKLGVSYIWSILFAPLIVTLSMQNFNVFGLYGLSYACVVPMLFYWLLCYHEKAKRRYVLYLFLLSGVIMFLHPYQYALVLVCSVLYISGYLLLMRNTVKQKWRHIVPVIIMIIGSFALLKAVTYFTDPVTDRPDYPHGLLSYGTTGTDIFTNEHSPYWASLRGNLIAEDAQLGNTDSYAYTGVVTLLVISLTLLAIPIQKLRKKPNTQNDLNTVHPIWWFIAVVALLFSMGVPFVWGLEWVFEYVGALRQFRKLCWFALLFYYIVTVISVVIISRKAQQLAGEKKWLRHVLLIIPLSIWGYESMGVAGRFHKESLEGNYNYNFVNSHLERKWVTFLQENNLSANDFQAILYMPYYHVGSEKIWLSRSGWGFCVSLKAAYQLQLPMVDANMSRSSWEQTFKQVKIGAGPYVYKSLLHDAKDNRPFLLMHLEGEELTPDERYLFQFADSIGVNSNLVTYALYPEKIAALERKEWERIRTCARTDTAYYYEPFSRSLSKLVAFGDGAQMAVTGKDTLIADIDVRNWPTNKLYEVSAWFFVNNKDYRTPHMVIKFRDSTGTDINMLKLECGESNDTDHMWFRPSRYFTLPEGTSKIALSLNVSSDVLWHRLDEVMIRAAEDTIIQKGYDNMIMVNNHLLPQ